MTYSNKSRDFEKISLKIFEDFTFHEKNIREACVKSSIVTLEKFFEDYQREIRDINTQVTPVKDRPTIFDFAETLKVFESYPLSIEKPKKSFLKDASSTQRGIKASQSVGDVPLITAQKDHSLPLNSSKDEEVLPASETYSLFKKCMVKLKQLISQCNDKEMTKKYETALNDLSLFGRQIKKFAVSEPSEHEALSLKEEKSLHNLVDNMGKLIFIKNNQDLFQSTIGTESTDRMDFFMDILDHLRKSSSI